MVKKMKIWDNPEELRKELQRIADELGLPMKLCSKSGLVIVNR